jgi:outer membrane protein
MRRSISAGVLAMACLVPLSRAQDQPVSIQAARVPAAIRPYMAPTIPPIHLQNSSRLDGLIRAGNLYLTVPDALALAIENNLNLEISRYGPLLFDSALDRALAGGPNRGVPAGNAQISSVNAGVGVNGSAASAGLGGGGGGNGGGGGGGGATIQQVGAVVPNFDPTLQNTTNFSHLTTPEANTIVSQTEELIQSAHTYNSLYSQGFLTGGQAQFREFQQTFGENAPGDFVNPSSSVRMDLIYRQPLLQGFGIKLNDRSIRIARLNTTSAREQFRSQLLDLVTSVLNLYYGLVAANDELKARQRAMEIAHKFLEDTKKEIAAQAIPGIQLPRAEAEVSTRRQEALIAQANVRQQEILLKEAVSHTEDPRLEAAGIVLVDRIEIPDTDDLPPLRELVATAMAKRPDVAVSRYRDQATEINLAGTANPLLPTLNLTLQTFDRGVGGEGHVVNGAQPNPTFVGGYGGAFSQVFRRNFPNNAASLGFSAPVGNRSAQADYGIDQLQYRQSQISNQKSANTIVVDVAARMAAVKQAHTRYSTARDTRTLQEQLLQADQQRFQSGAKGTTFDTLMTDERALVTAEISEGNALAAYARARTLLDQVLGETLEKNNISLEEGLNGRVARQSQIPDVLDPPKK